MSAFWRVAGLNYVQYSNIAAQTVRQALKGEATSMSSYLVVVLTMFVFLDIVSIKFQKWDGGKPVGDKK